MSSLKPSTIITGFLFSYVSANLFEFEPQRQNRIASCSEVFTAKVVLLSSKLSRNRNGTFSLHETYYRGYRMFRRNCDTNVSSRLPNAEA